MGTFYKVYLLLIYHSNLYNNFRQKQNNYIFNIIDMIIIIRVSFYSVNFSSSLVHDIPLNDTHSLIQAHKIGKHPQIPFSRTLLSSGSFPSQYLDSQLVLWVLLAKRHAGMKSGDFYSLCMFTPY